MSDNDHKNTWLAWRDQELKNIQAILDELGFELDNEQVHIAGERYLASGKKLVLLAHNRHNQKIVIKISRSREEVEHIKAERLRRRVLNNINFSYHSFLSPKELFFGKNKSYTILATKYIEQKKNFMDRSLEEQFFLALKNVDILAGVHATTSEHAEIIKKVFGEMTTKDYLNQFKNYKTNILKVENSDLAFETLSKAEIVLKNQSRFIDLYTDFLTHWDFVPHNIRINKGNIYLLDHSAIRFGNKHEGLARFINFMILYRPALADALLDYIRQNKTAEESDSLRLMRIYRLSDLIDYYSSSLDRADEQLKKLNKKRISFWLQIMSDILENKKTDSSHIESYKKFRDSLRTPDELARQKNLH